MRLECRMRDRRKLEDPDCADGECEQEYLNMAEELIRTFGLLERGPTDGTKSC